MLAGAAIAIDMLAGPVVVTRRAPSVYVGGISQPGAPSTVTVRATVLAIDPRTLRDLPEGVRTDASLTMHSRGELREDDEITWGGELYEVTFVWPRVEGGFWKAVLAKKDPAR